MPNLRNGSSSNIVFPLYNIVEKSVITWLATQGCRGGHGPPDFCIAKRKKETKGKKERVSKQKLLKGCHQGQNIIVLTIPERLEFENFCCRPTMVAEASR